jgi:CBS domain-containing protein
VRDVMTREVATVSPDTPIADAGKLLFERRFGCLPVVDANNFLQGIVTSSDFVRMVVHAEREPGR